MSRPRRSTRIQGPYQQAAIIPIVFAALLVVVHGGARADSLVLYGGCCLPGGTCIQTDQTSCLVAGGTFLGEVPCTPDPCNPPVGACCYPDGSCQMTPASGCDSQYGIWLGPGYICDPCNPCVQCAGSCCWPDGSCTFESTYSCCIRDGNPNCMEECESLRCSTADIPEDGPPARNVTWGKVRTLYR